MPPIIPALHRQELLRPWDEEALGRLQLVHDLRGRRPALDVELEHRADDVGDGRGDLVGNVRTPALHEDRAREVREVVAALVGKRTPEDLDENAPHRPDVDLFRNFRLVVEQLRSHVPRRFFDLSSNNSGAM